MTLDLIPADAPALLAVAGEAANRAAAQDLFANYRARKAANTRRRQDDGLALLAHFLRAPQPAGAGIPGVPTAAALAGDPAAWAGITWGLVDRFVQWLLAQGCAIGSVNGHLSTVKTSARLAMQAGALEHGEYVALRAVAGYGRTEGKRIDETRPATRAGAKKAAPVPVAPEQAARLKAQPPTPQGRRDAFLLCLLMDRGLRGRGRQLAVTDFDLAAGELRFYRLKVDKMETHKLTPATLAAARAYMDVGDAPAMGPLLRSSRKGGALTDAGLTRTITERVRDLEAAVGLVGLSAYDLHHYWATRAARNPAAPVAPGDNGTPLDRLQDAGGWVAPAMPLRYVETAKIANQGVLLDG